MCGCLSHLGSERRLQADGTLMRFQVEPGVTDWRDDRRRPVTVACCAAVADAHRGPLERMVSSHSEVGITGCLGPYTGRKTVGRRRSAFEISVTDIWPADHSVTR